jgi:hypothetical protein
MERRGRGGVRVGVRRGVGGVGVGVGGVRVGSHLADQDVVLGVPPQDARAARLWGRGEGGGGEYAPPNPGWERGAEAHLWDIMELIAQG